MTLEITYRPESPEVVGHTNYRGASGTSITPNGSPDNEPLRP